MGYALQYDLQTIKVTKNKKNYAILRYLAMTFVLLLCTVAMYLGGTVFQTIILGDRIALKTAAEQMVTDVRGGTPLGDAVEAFYTELAE